MSLLPALEARARTLGQSLPPLLAQADLLAATVLSGEHGRKRAGRGDEFWQYRPASLGDSARQIDWRKSSRSDQLYVREREWQAAQSLTLWLDQGRAMDFSSHKNQPDKADRARLLALALALLALRGGERVALLGQRPKAGRAQVSEIAAGLFETVERDHTCPDPLLLPDHGWLVLISDFLGPIAEYEAFLQAAAARGLRGVLLQVLDPAEEDFPYKGRVVFRSMGDNVRHETLQADDLRGAYQARLAERKAALMALSRSAAWHYQCHNSAASAQKALLSLYHYIGAAQ